MSKAPSTLSKTPEMEDNAASRESRVREGLRCLQLSGAFFLRAELRAPWAYASPSSDVIAEALQAGNRRIVLFHIFTEGQCTTQLGDGSAAEFEAGDIAIFPFADPHAVGYPTTDRAVPLHELLPPMPWSHLPLLRIGGSGTPTQMICGYLLCDDLPLNPVLGSLPRVLRVRAADGPLAHWVKASAEFALHATEHLHQSDPLMQRLPELLFTECVCDFARREPESSGGWLAGLADPYVGRALSCIHRQPDAPWTVEALAKRAATSRSVLDERFRTLLGRAPMAYLTAFRMQLASRQLRTTNATMADVASSVGYASEASFSKAFKRHVGVAPSEWREGR
jgi:AraC-like DNA-binding protein